MTRAMRFTRAVLCGAVVVMMTSPSYTSASPLGCARHRTFVATHETLLQLRQQQQQQQQRQQKRGVYAVHSLLSAFVTIRPCSTNNGISGVRGVPSATTSQAGLARCTRRRCSSYSEARPRLTAMRAAASGKNKNSKAAKKKKRGPSGGGSSRGTGSGGGFGAPSAAAASAVKIKGGEGETAPTTATSTASRGGPRRTSSSSSSQPLPPAAGSGASHKGELPDDDFATFPPLSPDTLKSVMGVDVFELPAGGVTASEEGQQNALPLQVLECIRERHGMPEFAGGRRLLDAEYEVGGLLGTEGGHQERPADLLADRRPLLFPGLRLLHAEPPVVGVDNFFTAQECDEYVSRSVSPPPTAPGTGDATGGGSGRVGGGGPHMQRSATLGADVDAVAQRTSTTWFHRFSAVPELMAKASALVGVPFEEGRWEEAQTVRYRPGEKFTWHLDALPPTPELASNGGQRIATLLVYLTDLPEGDGGATAFRDLGPLRVRPCKGSALLFFPSCGGAPNCPFDIRTLHAGEVVRPGGQQDKWIAQLWLRERRYTPTVPKDNKHADAESVVAKFDDAWRSAVRS